MRAGSYSVTDAVREIISRNRSIYDCIKMDLINYTALAAKIQKDVEEMVGGPVHLNTIVVAIKRCADSLSPEQRKIEDPLLKGARLSLTGGVSDIELPTDSFGIDDTANIMSKFSEIDPNYGFFRLTDSFRILTENFDAAREILESFAAQENMFRSGLAKITIHIPENQSKSDIVSYVSEILHEKGIEIVNAYFGYEEVILILREEDAAKAYEALRSEISKTA